MAGRTVDTGRTGMTGRTVDAGSTVDAGRTGRTVVAGRAGRTVGAGRAGRTAGAGGAGAEAVEPKGDLQTRGNRSGKNAPGSVIIAEAKHGTRKLDFSLAFPKNLDNETS